MRQLSDAGSRLGPDVEWILLVKEGLENNDLVTGLNETHESTQHALIIFPRSVLAVRHLLARNHSPSFAPVVIVTSVSGSKVRPKDAEYASAMAFFRRGRPWRMMSYNSK